MDGGRAHPTEAHRFTNRPVRLDGTLHWDVLALYQGGRSSTLSAAARATPCCEARLPAPP
ncbi:hypothetical protein AB0C14_37175 [Microbispora hainanensis]|uniref:hypothetical protein n=1 Tax=Microbispora hainanensis TaxID=568844 RepID=UPI003402EC0C